MNQISNVTINILLEMPVEKKQIHKCFIKTRQTVSNNVLALSGTWLLATKTC